ncbi:hypothetical protein SKAU_G00021100 [Synaphobranchus kaupii]|uniref:KN homeodomain domain-containing protein n=1 Tax=Synaphobranchus kaupii TaxID=118154 RepID=A0A9Q1GDN4_SYNKA|nr:hypothetical protein SKAU_G00021100 [Synaphobranchus kaupii]
MPRRYGNMNSSSSEDNYQGSSVGDRDGACCPCQACACPCHRHQGTSSRMTSSSSEGGQKRALFLERRYPSIEQKSQLLVEGVQMKTINKWFINYRYSMFNALRKRAERKILATSTEAEVNHLVPRDTKLAFKHMLSNGRELMPQHDSCFSSGLAQGKEKC